MRTFLAMLRAAGRSTTGSAAARMAASTLRGASPSQDGFALIEVIVSALLVGLIVIATLTGFDVANRTTTDERAHAQADGLAQQDEDRLRSLQVSQLTRLSESREVTYNGTHYTIKSTAKFVADATGSESCTAGSTTADYIQTTSEVSWPALKKRPSVVETGLIAPRLGGSLLVKVIEPAGKGVGGMTVTATGPSPSTGQESGTTDANGCVIFGSVEPGEYSVTTSQTGYVDKNGNSEPPATERAATIINGSTTKKEFEFGQAGAIQVTFANSATSDQFVAFNTGMTTFRTFGTAPVNANVLTSPTTVFPFTGAYSVYAGTCESNDPHALSAANVDSTATVTGGASAKALPLVTVPPVAIKVMSGKSGSPGSAIEKATVRIQDTGCNTVEEGTTTSTGALPHPNMPFGKYSLCVTGGKFGGTGGLGKEKKYTVAFTNDTATGPSAITAGTLTNGGTNAGKEAIIYLGTGAATTPGKLESGFTAVSCP